MSFTEAGIRFNPLSQIGKAFGLRDWPILGSNPRHPSTVFLPPKDIISVVAVLGNTTSRP
jgi:hypothetical protein